MRSIRVKGGGSCFIFFFLPMTLELLEVREKCHFPYSSKTMGYINRKRRLCGCKASDNKAEVPPTHDRQQMTARAEQHFAAEVTAAQRGPLPIVRRVYTLVIRTPNFGRTITHKLKALPAHWFPSQWPVHRIL